MLGKLLWKTGWGVTKLGVKYVVVPLAISAAIGALAGEWADRLREEKDVEPVITPER